MLQIIRCIRVRYAIASQIDESSFEYNCGVVAMCRMLHNGIFIGSDILPFQYRNDLKRHLILISNYTVYFLTLNV